MRTRVKLEFAQASAQFDPDYFLRPKDGQKWFGSGGTASGTLSQKEDKADSKSDDKKSGSSAGGLHAEQHFTYHRHLKPGDVLSAENKPGESWEKESKRAGVLKFSESITEYRDQNGELVFESVTVTGEKEYYIKIEDIDSDSPSYGKSFTYSI